MSNPIQPYHNQPNQPDLSRLLMIAAFVYTVAPDLIPGPIDDTGVIILALVVIGLLNLFGGSK